MYKAHAVLLRNLMSTLPVLKALPDGHIGTQTSVQ